MSRLLSCGDFKEDVKTLLDLFFKTILSSNVDENQETKESDQIEENDDIDDDVDVDVDDG